MSVLAVADFIAGVDFVEIPEAAPLRPFLLFLVRLQTVVARVTVRLGPPVLLAVAHWMVDLLPFVHLDL